MGGVAAGGLGGCLALKGLFNTGLGVSCASECSVFDEVPGGERAGVSFFFDNVTPRY